MPKEKKFNLPAIKVESFVTALNDEEKSRVKGGYDVPYPTYSCDTGCASVCRRC